MPRGFDYRRRRPWLAWGAEREWPPLNPIPGDPNTYVYISSDHTTDPPPVDDDGGGETEVSGVPQALQPPIISSASYESAGLGLADTYPAAWGYQVWTANLAAYIAFVVPEDMTVNRLWWINGATVNGNSEAAILNAGATAKICTTGVVANSGASTIQSTSFAGVTLTSNTLYWFAYGSDSGTHTILVNNATATQTIFDYSGGKENIAGYSAGITAPATLNVATISSLPMIFASAVSVL